MSINPYIICDDEFKSDVILVCFFWDLEPNVEQLVGTEKSTGVSNMGSRNVWDEKGVVAELGDVWEIIGDNLGVFFRSRGGTSWIDNVMLVLSLGNLKSLHGGNWGTETLGFLVMGRSKDLDLWMMRLLLESNNESDVIEETSVRESVSR